MHSIFTRVCKLVLGLFPKVSRIIGRGRPKSEQDLVWETVPFDFRTDWYSPSPDSDLARFPPLNCRCYYCRNKLSTPHDYVFRGVGDSGMSQ